MLITTDRARKARQDENDTYALFLEGKTTKEVAAALGVRRETVLLRLRRYERRQRWAAKSQADQEQTKPEHRCPECGTALEVTIGRKYV